VTAGTDACDRPGAILSAVETNTEDTMTNITNSFETKRRGGLIGGLFLVGLGLYLLVAQFIRAEWMGMLILPGLSLIFLAWGLFTRNAGLLVPGGILGGIALGAYLTSNTFKDGMDVTQGAVFLLAFAAGWALITVLSALIGQRQLWPLIPGGILAAIGALMLVGDQGLTVLEWIGRLWPLALIAGGLATLWRVLRR
jgi:hypothetical protein